MLIHLFFDKKITCTTLFFLTFFLALSAQYNIPRDTNFCASNTITFRFPDNFPGGNGPIFEWSDGSQGGMFSTSIEGQYWLKITMPNGAISIDTFDVHACPSTHACNMPAQNSLWMYGKGFSLDFRNMTNNLPAVNSITNNMNTTESGNVLLDANGNILFYTDGENVYNSNHNLIQNGSGLYGNGPTGAKTSSYILPHPGDENIYYVFTMSDYSRALSSHGLFYSIIDATLDNGNGGVTQKNVLISHGSCENIAVLNHCNGRDFWIAARTRNNNIKPLHIYKLDINGFDATPAFIYNNFNASTKITHTMAISKEQDKIAILNTSEFYAPNTLKILDFNTSTGEVTDYITMDSVALMPVNNNLPSYMVYDDIYGMSFSPNGRFLYLKGIYFHRFDLQTSTFYTFPASRPIDQMNMFSNNTHLRLGPDNKIYTWSDRGFTLDIINDPNNEDEDLIDFQSRFIENVATSFNTGSIDYIQPREFNYTVNLQQLPSTSCDFPREETFVINSAACSDVDYLWRLTNLVNSSIVAQTDTSITIRFMQEINNAKIKVLVKAPCGLFEDSLQFNIVEGNTEYTNINVSVCSNETYDYNGQLLTADSTYVFNYTTAIGCDSIVTVIVNSYPDIVFSTNTLVNTSLTNPTGELTITTQNSANIYEYNFNNLGFSSSNIYSNLLGGIYPLQIRDIHNCFWEGTMVIVDSLITLDSTYIVQFPNAFTPNGDGENDTFKPIGIPAQFVKELKVYNRWGNLVFDGDLSTGGWDGKYKNELQARDIYIAFVKYILPNGEEKNARVEFILMQ